MLDLNQIRNDFPMLKQTMQSHPLAYLDNAATSLKPQQVIDRITRYFMEEGASVHRGDYDLSYQVSKEFEETRDVVAAFIHAKPKEIVYTSGASASLNLVAFGYGMQILQPGDVILANVAEHASNLLPWMKVAQATGAVIEYIDLDDQGRITVENFQKKMNRHVKIVAIAHVSNVLGYKAPVKEICAIAHQFGAKVVVDGAQSVPHFAVDVQDLDCDFLAFSSHKMVGPSGVGILYGKYDLLQGMEPNAFGGGSNARFDMCGNILLKEAPFKFESGTPAIEGILGFQEAVKYLDHIGMEEVYRHEKELHDYAVAKLSKLNTIELYNPHADCGILTFNVKDVFSQDAATYLNSKGIAVRAGLHCAKILTHHLHVSATVRASLYLYNTKEEVDRLADACATATPQTCLDVFF